jgi:hypothetical protein
MRVSEVTHLVVETPTAPGSAAILAAPLAELLGVGAVPGYSECPRCVGIRDEEKSKMEKPSR